MKKNKLFFKSFLCVFILLLILLFCFIPATRVLSISNRKNTSERFYLSAKKLSGFCISYTHSVNKGRVKDFYFFTSNDELCMDRTIFVSYGAGIPEPEETPGADFTVLENGYEISNLNRIVPKLTMAVGIIANHAISFFYSDKQNISEQTQEHFLTDYFAPQTSLILQIKRVSLIEYITHKLKPKK